MDKKQLKHNEIIHANGKKEIIHIKKSEAQTASCVKEIVSPKH